MNKSQKAYVIANFGGPRDLDEVEEFLIALLTDREVIRTRLPNFVHHWFFRRVAKKRALSVSEDYKLIGGKSPIFEDTQAVARHIADQTIHSVLTFHRYLPKTHRAFFDAIQKLECDEIVVFPMFPQFSYATTGSIQTFFSKHLNPATTKKLRWIESYATHPAFIQSFQNCIREFLEENQLKEQETILLFSAHGLPKQFIDTGDPYQAQCEQSFQQIVTAFPKVQSHLCYQSQFGRAEWIKPYTSTFCRQASEWAKGKQNIVFIPLSFTSDHIETLYEVEQLYLPIIKEQGFNAYRCSALNLRPDWLEAIKQIL